MAKFIVLSMLLGSVSCYSINFGNSLNWGSIGDESVELLQQLIRIKTINAKPDESETASQYKAVLDKLKDIKDEKKLAETFKTEMQKLSGSTLIVGNELELVTWVKKFLGKEGIESEIFETAPGRGCLLATLKGNGSKKPVMIMAHIDVVNVQQQGWTEADPFKAEIKDGYLYGRGSMDDKGMAACGIMTLVLLKRNGIKLSRDVKLLLTADEEAGGEFGIKYMVKHHKDKLDAEFALNEGGQIIKKEGKKLVFIQTAEKSIHNIIVKAKGKSGHSSVPHDKNPITTLAMAMIKIAQYRPPHKVSDVTAKFFDRMADIEVDEKVKVAMKGVSSTDPNTQYLAVETLTSLRKDEAFKYNALLRNTVTPTISRTGIRSNVIPSEAEALMNVRLLPGEDLEKFIEELTKVVARDDVTITPETPKEKREKDAPESPVDSHCYKAVEKIAAEMWGKDAIAMPVMSTGATDSRDLRKIGIDCYGLLPFPLTWEDLGRMHGDNERVLVEDFKKGIEFTYKFVKLVSE